MRGHQSVGVLVATARQKVERHRDVRGSNLHVVETAPEAHDLDGPEENEAAANPAIALDYKGQWDILGEGAVWAEDFGEGVIGAVSAILGPVELPRSGKVARLHLTDGVAHSDGIRLP